MDGGQRGGQGLVLAEPEVAASPVCWSAPGRHLPHGHRSGHVGMRPHRDVARLPQRRPRRCLRPRDKRRRKPNFDDHGPGLAQRRSIGRPALSRAASKPMPEKPVAAEFELVPKSSRGIISGTLDPRARRSAREVARPRLLAGRCRRGRAAGGEVDGRRAKQRHRVPARRRRVDQGPQLARAPSKTRTRWSPLSSTSAAQGLTAADREKIAANAQAASRASHRSAARLSARSGPATARPLRSPPRTTSVLTDGPLRRRS